MTATTKPLPKKHGRHDIPRRQCIDALHPVELTIYEGMHAVELLGADTLLTNAMTKMQEAQALVADWLEGATG